MRHALALALLLAPASCDDTPGKWASTVYPDASDRSHFLTTYRFKTLEMCKRAAEEQIATFPDPKKADYRCAEADPPER
jgi:hypothetical protein